MLENKVSLSGLQRLGEALLDSAAATVSGIRRVVGDQAQHLSDISGAATNGVVRVAPISAGLTTVTYVLGLVTFFAHKWGLNPVQVVQMFQRIWAQSAQLPKLK